MKFTLCGGPHDGTVMDFSDPACTWGGSAEDESGQRPIIQVGVTLTWMALYRRVLVDEDEALYAYDDDATMDLRQCEMIRRTRRSPAAGR